MNTKQFLWTILTVACLVYGITIAMSDEAHKKTEETERKDRQAEQARSAQTAVVAIASDEQEDDDDGHVVIGDDEDDALEVFYPTNEWQTIKPGQAIPAGLHVRINLQTGLKEAKLIEKDDKKEQKSDGGESLKFWEEGDRKGMVNTEDKFFTKKTLKDALKLFKAKQDDVKHEPEGHAEHVKNNFRPYEELKKEFANMNMNIETDAEILTKLLNIYKRDDASVAEKEAILSDLEYYVHQIDNARDFHTLGGLELIIKGLNDTEEVIRRDCAFVLGSAVQSNPAVQVQALEGGALQLLLRLMSTHQTVAVKKKALYAISSLLRQFPFAQKKFLELGGLSALSSLFKETDLTVLQLKLKAITLLHDLLVEQKDVKNSEISDSVHKEKQRQYNEVRLLPALIQQGWCELIPTLLSVPEHDNREKVLNAMQIMSDNCTEQYKQKTNIEILKSLKAEYDNFAVEEAQEQDADRYFTGLRNLIRDLLNGLNTHTEL
ncbi:nucleotide exchange factor SIL1-like [Ptychodera flava]|uniref:nucleotide exchange factor SIL1-like n=1 Tax=Ptychodera flava TaxID=63121 RepID=UPI00396A5A29